MTKEELEKEANGFANKWLEEVKDLELYHKTGPKPEYIRIQEAYLAGAEPREKRIAELEAQIEKMKCWCNCKNYLSCLEEYCRKNISFEKGICYYCKKWELRR